MTHLNEGRHEGRPVVLCILDGWGYRSDPEDNAIALARTPVWDQMIASCPMGFLEASAEAVGLPPGQMGNSEVGHTTIGGGRVVLMDLLRINRAVADGRLRVSPDLVAFAARLKNTGGTAHLLGLLSPGGVHAHQDHLLVLVEALVRGGVPVAIHAFLDGRDVPPRSARKDIAAFEARLATITTNFGGTARIATVSGRFYAMDRDRRWPRVARAYGCLVAAQGERAVSADAAVGASYDQETSDEFVLPTVIGDYGGMQDGDGLLMANFRADRVREILTALLDPGFDAFERPQQIRFAASLGMVSYSEELDAWLPALFPTISHKETLGEWVAMAGRTQLRIAETEKYAHVTFFFNGGEERVFPGEERILVASPSVATYDQQPQMSAVEVTDKLTAAIDSRCYDLIVANYANGDMVGHTGILPAAIQAAETIDTALGRLREAVSRTGATLVILADHGNCELMVDPESGQPHTAHTMNPVPMILVNAPESILRLAAGRLSDVAPTVLALMGLSEPEAMTGHSLLRGGIDLDQWKMDKLAG